ncbi:radical SAM protein [Sphingorhabdus sp. IMCC26285]|uniref:Radical SAM protein n=1 Tax=Sphingorhabdus profundilacus TaxID=2509718 RepID=A0A6I4M100_9SPHN|nr:radical SAM protein [Sphingorhabdus profundilacus]MVZ97924.1 radical SAM protein [Sphingorhabdus profundilacus]
MSIELRPLGVACNIACQYCYQNSLRDVAATTPKFDFDAVTSAADAMDEPLNLFGGEPLLLPLADIERLIRFNCERFGRAPLIQSNGALLTPDHVAVFGRYGAKVGISVDGPGALNDARWAGSLKRTRVSTAATLLAIDLLLDAGLCNGIMVQIGRANGVGERLDELCTWLAELDRKGVPSARIHVLELDGTAARAAHGLSVAENVIAVTRLVELAKGFQTLRFDISSDRRDMLMMDDEAVACTFRACDPLVTEAVVGLGGDGEPHKCGLTDKEGIDFLKADEPRHERYLALYHTPQAYGGCHDCRFFLVCKGQCPGSAIEGDWRNRSDNCEAWRQLFAHAEAELVAEGSMPISIHPRRPEVEAVLVDAWSRGENPTLASLRGTLGLDLAGSQP